MTTNDQMLQLMGKMGEIKALVNQFKLKVADWHTAKEYLRVNHYEVYLKMLEHVDRHKERKS